MNTVSVLGCECKDTISKGALNQMDNRNDSKDRTRLVLYIAAGGYLIYQGVTLIKSLLKDDSKLSDNLMYYIFSVFFILFGLVIFYFVYRSYKKQKNEAKNSQQIDHDGEFAIKEELDGKEYEHIKMQETNEEKTNEDIKE